MINFCFMVFKIFIIPKAKLFELGLGLGLGLEGPSLGLGFGL